MDIISSAFIGLLACLFCFCLKSKSFLLIPKTGLIMTVLILFIGGIFKLSPFIPNNFLSKAIFVISYISFWGFFQIALIRRLKIRD